VLAFSLRDGGKYRSFGQVSRCRAEIQTGRVQNTSQKHYYLSHLAQLDVSCHVNWSDEKFLQNFSQKPEWRIQGESSWRTGWKECIEVNRIYIYI
jgi:hypothetical protein